MGTGAQRPGVARDRHPRTSRVGALRADVSAASRAPGKRRRRMRGAGFTKELPSRGSRGCNRCGGPLSIGEQPGQAQFAATSSRGAVCLGLSCTVLVTAGGSCVCTRPRLPGA